MKDGWKEKIDQIIGTHSKDRDPEIMILQGVQKEFGYTGKEFLEYIAQNTDFSLTKLYGIVTFYQNFKIHPPGKNMIHICQGTACHVRGGARVRKELGRLLGIKPGQTTEDRLFSLESVRCLGCCGLSPVIMINGKTYGRVKPNQLAEILESYRGDGSGK